MPEVNSGPEGLNNRGNHRRLVRMMIDILLEI